MPLSALETFIVSALQAV